ncbi:MAG: hypothetical protein DRN04_17640 [Thermoprotei archaeon]|nr:MAG: hypothetical protein DRN04_17640 [Thermoprotei archaeon]
MFLAAEKNSMSYIIFTGHNILLLITFEPYVRGVYGISHASMIISSAIIVGIALYEEKELICIYGKRYIEYYKRSPFLISLLKLLMTVISKHL